VIFELRCGCAPDPDVFIVINPIEISFSDDNGPAVILIFIDIDIYIGCAPVPGNYRTPAPTAVAVIGFVGG
jgi:hypothetical protein